MRPMSSLILKRASASRSSGEWSDDDFDVLADGVVVGRIIVDGRIGCDPRLAGARDAELLALAFATDDVDKRPQARHRLKGNTWEPV